jgi:pimeloyl-ACP methyl ester carboxylesterase
MPSALTDDGIRLHVEETGTGEPVVFIHEFAGDHRSWAAQVRHLAPRFRCLTYAARGYPPSDVPRDPASYSQPHAVADAVAVLDAMAPTSSDCRWAGSVPFTWPWNIRIAFCPA